MSHGVGRLRRSLDHQYAAAVSVSSGALIALAWSALSSTSYQHTVLAPWFRGHESGLHTVVLNGAMTIFFSAIGLELSRELRSNLRHHPRASLAPLLGAVGGMAATALLSLGLGAALTSSALTRGWGVPMATDIAFTLGVLALAGPRVPAPLRIFLLTLAVADDVLSVIVLAATGVSHVRFLGLAALVGVVVLALVLARRVHPVVAFFLMVVPLWFCFVWAGVDPALSGVVAGLVTPVSTPAARQLEVTITRCSVAAVLPLFALVACGVTWTSISATGATGKIIFATIAVRVFGKVLGIGAGVYLAGRCGARRDESLTVPVLWGATLLCAIGFTVPLLFASALFSPTSATYGAFTVGLLGASLVGAGAGVTILRRVTR